MMGQSGGRSRENRVGQGADLRATQRERDLVDPPRRTSWDRVDEKGLHDEPFRSSLELAWMSVFAFLVLTLWVTGCAFLGFWIALKVL
jgi:hypothetical protein